MNNIFTTSRSHYQSYLDSPRLFYVTYCAKGTGLAPKLVNPNLAIGTFVHEVCGSVMSGGSEADAIKHQTEIFQDSAQTRGVDSPFSPETLLALAQGLSKTWLRVRLPQIKKDFEILAVEQERKLSIHDDTLQLLIPVRLDAELKNRYSGTYHALEMKTTSSQRSYSYERYSYNIQPLMHTWVMHHVYGSCSDIMMEFLYKGWGADQGKKWHSVFLKGYEKIGVPPFDKNEYEVEYKRARGKDWTEIFVPDRFNQDEWHALLGSKLDTIVSMESIVRSEKELPDFQFQMFEAHKRIVEGLSALEATKDKIERRAILNIYFPLAYHMFDRHLIGFDPDDDGIMDSGDWIRREPHHPLEKETLGQAQTQ